MHARALTLAVALLAVPLLAGCAVPGALSPASVVPDVKGLLAQTATQWPDHQNEPHPGYGWPTLTHPATGPDIPSWWKPIPPADIPAKITGMKLVTKGPAGVKTGAGTAVFGSLAIVPGFSKENYVVDLSDPKAPKLLGTWEGAERGAATMAFPDGRLYGVISTGDGFDVVNLTDPTHPEIVGNASPTTGGHKLGVVPGTPIVYNANSNGGGPMGGLGTGDGQTEIYDLTDPTNPALVKEFKNGYGCHHIFFWIDASKDKERALCAGIQVTQIWDIKDPKDPKVISTISMPFGSPSPSAPDALIFSHTALLNEKGTVLVVGDELSGGGPGVCDGVHTPAKDASGPLGNLWFYDVKDEKNPKLLGWISPPPSQSTDPKAPAAPSNPANVFGTVFGIEGCTAHHGRLVPDPEGKRDILVMAWYSAGVVMIDFTDPANAKIVDEWNPGTNTWEAWYDNGYIVTGDLNRGIDILALK